MDGRGDKLRRAHQLRPRATAYFLVLGKARVTSQFLTKVRSFIKKHKLCLEFEVVRCKTVHEWLKAYPPLQLRFSPPEQGRTLGGFLGQLKEQLAVQGGSVEFAQYDRLDQLYVEPKEFARIFDVLQEKRVVLLVGPPHVGKTFTAAYMLWQFYSNFSRKPRWILPKGLRPEPEVGTRPPRLREPGQSRTRLIGENVGNDKVTYVEDPFGRTSDEEVAWDYLDPGQVLSEVVQHVQRDAPDALVIVTSREHVLEKALTGRPELRQLVVRMQGSVRLSTGSYSKEQKHELLRRYASLHACVWSVDGIPPDVYERAGKLPTPHAIAHFCKLAKTARTPAVRAKHFRKASHELVKAFAGEIERLEETALAALLMAHMFGTSPYLFASAFPRLTGPDPVTTLVAATSALGSVGGVSARGLSLSYVHPSYREALHLAVTKNERVRGLFREACERLVGHQEPNVRSRTARGLASKWDELDRDTRAAVDRLAEDPEALVREGVAHGLDLSGLHLGIGARRALYKLLTDTQAEVRARAASVLVCRWQSAEPEGRRLVYALTEDPDPTVRLEVAGLAGLWSELKRKGKQAVLLLARDPDLEVRRLLVGSFSFGLSLSGIDASGLCLLATLAQDGEAEIRGQGARLLAMHWDALEADQRAMLMEVPYEPEAEVRGGVAEALGSGWPWMDAEGRVLLASLANDADASVREQAASGLGEVWDLLDGDGRAMLIQLARDRKATVRGGAAYGIGRKWASLDMEGRKEFVALAFDKKAEVRDAAAWALTDRIAYARTMGDTLAARVADDTEARMHESVGRFSRRGWTDIDKEGRTVLARLAADTDPKVRRTVGLRLCSYWAELDARGRKILFGLARDAVVGVRMGVARHIGFRWRDLDAKGRALVVKLARDPSAKVRQATAVALADKWRDLNGTGRALLVALARDPKASVRKQVASGLGRSWPFLDGDGRAVVLELSGDRQAAVRKGIALALGGSRLYLDTERRAVLAGLASDRSCEVREAASAALAKERAAEW